MSRFNKLLLVAFFSLMSRAETQAQKDIYDGISNAVEADMDIDGYKNTLKYLKEQKCLFSDDVIIPYLETTVEGDSKVDLVVNTVRLKPNEDYILLSSGGNASIPAGFYSSDEVSKTNSFTYIRMKKFIDRNLGLEGNKKRGFNSLKSLIRAKNFQNVILIDDFGMSSVLMEGLKDYVDDLRSNIAIVNYEASKEHFPEPSFYYTEASSKSTKKNIKKSYYKIQNRKQTTQNISLTGILPEDNNEAQKNHLKSVLYNYVTLTKQMPGVHITLYLVPLTDFALMKKGYFRDLKNEQLLLGSIIFRNLSPLFPQHKLFAEGQHIRDPRKAIHGAEYSFQINYTENNYSKEMLIPSSNELALVIGSPNSENTWHQYDQATLDDLVRLLRNYIQFQITSHAGDRSKKPTRTGF